MGQIFSWIEQVGHGLDRQKEYDDNEQETSETKSEEFALKMECTCFCKPIKG